MHYKGKNRRGRLSFPALNKLAYAERQLDYFMSSKSRQLRNAHQLSFRGASALAYFTVKNEPYVWLFTSSEGLKWESRPKSASRRAILEFVCYSLHKQTYRTYRVYGPHCQDCNDHTNPGKKKQPVTIHFFL